VARPGGVVRAEGGDQVAVRGDVFQPVEANAAALGRRALEEVAGAGLGIRAERRDEVAMRGDVFQAVEGNAACFGAPQGVPVGGGRVRVQAEGRDQVRLRRQVLPGGEGPFGGRRGRRRGRWSRRGRLGGRGVGARIGQAVAPRIGIEQLRGGELGVGELEQPDVQHGVRAVTVGHVVDDAEPAGDGGYGMVGATADEEQPVRPAAAIHAVVAFGDADDVVAAEGDDRVVAADTLDVVAEIRAVDDVVERRPGHAFDVVERVPAAEAVIVGDAGEEPHRDGEG
jgi:hypothetical protein